MCDTAATRRTAHFGTCALKLPVMTNTREIKQGDVLMLPFDFDEKELMP